MNKKDFSLDNFKKWIDEQEVQKENEIARSTIGIKKLISKIDIEDGDVKEVCKDFFENGGKIISKENKKYLIEVSTGTFYLHKLYLEI